MRFGHSGCPPWKTPAWKCWKHPLRRRRPIVAAPQPQPSLSGRSPFARALVQAGAERRCRHRGSHRVGPRRPRCCRCSIRRRRRRRRRRRLNAPPPPASSSRMNQRDALQRPDAGRRRERDPRWRRGCRCSVGSAAAAGASIRPLELRGCRDPNLVSRQWRKARNPGGCGDRQAQRSLAFARAATGRGLCHIDQHILLLRPHAWRLPRRRRPQPLRRRRARPRRR